MILVVVTRGLEVVEVDGVDVGAEGAGVFIELETDGDWLEEFALPAVFVDSNIDNGDAPSDVGDVAALACAVLNPPNPTNVMTASIDRISRPPLLCHRGRAAPKVDVRGRAALTATRSLELPPGFATLNLPDVIGCV